MTAYYNEIDPHAAAWLRELIAGGHIAPGDVDERSIVDVRPDDLRGYSQCHFFAGIGGWSYALRLAGIADSRLVWSGSCPCQPFSAAGKQRGSEDERHLWPAFFDLIRECRPGAVVGEQVAGGAGYAWWDHVAADLEGAGYAAAAANLGAHSVGSPHIRQRLYWVAHAANGNGRSGVGAEEAGVGSDRIGGRRSASGGPDGGMADADGAGPSLERIGGLLDRQRPAFGNDADGRGKVCWSDLIWLTCSDGKSRPAKPGVQPLVAGLSRGVVRGSDPSAPIDANNTPEARVMRLRGYGNAIVPQVAAAFVTAAMT